MMSSCRKNSIPQNVYGKRVFIFLYIIIIHNTRKVISEDSAFLVPQQCILSLGCKVNTIRMSQPDMGSISHLKNQWNILVVLETILWIIKIIKIKCFYPPRILIHLFMFTITAQRELISIFTQIIRNSN